LCPKRGVLGVLSKRGPGTHKAHVTALVDALPVLVDSDGRPENMGRQQEGGDNRLCRGVHDEERLRVGTVLGGWLGCC